MVPFDVSEVRILEVVIVLAVVDPLFSNIALGCVLYQRPDRNSREEEGQGCVGMPRSQTQQQQYCCTNSVKDSYRIKGAAGNSGLLALVSANRHDARATGRTHKSLPV